MKERFTLVPALMLRLILGMVFSILIDLLVRGIIGLESKLTAATGSAMTETSRNNAEPLPGKRETAGLPIAVSPGAR